MSSLIVGIADMKVARAPDVITTIGLGSCVGITMYDIITHIGGMAHIMLPDSNSAHDKTNVAKFADSALPELLKRVLQTGAKKNSLIVKLAGGASMFSTSSSMDMIKVGARNVIACHDALKRLGLSIKAEDTGGTHGRTIELHTLNGDLFIKTIGHGSKTI